MVARGPRHRGQLVVVPRHRLGGWGVAVARRLLRSARANPGLHGRPKVRFILKNIHFLLKNVDFLLKNVDFLLKFIRRPAHDTTAATSNWSGGGCASAEAVRAAAAIRAWWSPATADEHVVVQQHGPRRRSWWRRSWWRRPRPWRSAGAAAARWSPTSCGCSPEDRVAPAICRQRREHGGQPGGCRERITLPVRFQ